MTRTLDTYAASPWLRPERLRDGELSLDLDEIKPGNARRKYVPQIRWHLIRDGRDNPAGYVNIRIGNTPEILLYVGHIGYFVEPDCRGRHFAERATRLLLPFARSEGLNPLWITCNPDNLPSRRTIERLGAEFVKIVDVPRNTDMYERGETQKCRYRLDL